MGILISNGHDGLLLDHVSGAVKAAGGKVKIIAPSISGALDHAGDLREADFAFEAGSSVLFDAVAILLGTDDADIVVQIPQVQNFLRDAFAHGKFIGHAFATPLFAAAGLAGKADDGCFDLGDADREKPLSEFIAECANLRFWGRKGLA